MKIGLLSDTHGYLDSRVFEYFAECDEIWHAGDIGSMDIAKELEAFKPLRAVYGNIDDLAIQKKYPEDLRFDCEGMDVWITHIAGSPPHYHPRIRQILKAKAPQILVCGHSHMLKVKKDDKYAGMLYLNPGAAGNQGFHKIKTLLRFEIKEGQIGQLQVIDLGQRGLGPHYGS